MEKNYTYPVILDYIDDEMIEVTVPNFPDLCTCVEKEKYIEQIQDFIAITIVDYEERGKDLPEPFKADEIEIKDNQTLLFVNLWMPYYRSKVKINYVRKTLTIPSWLDILAKEKNINFSAALVKALKEQLGIEK